jgi:hypothetical protein
MPTVGFNVETWTHKFKVGYPGILSLREQKWDAVGSVEATIAGF